MLAMASFAPTLAHTLAKFALLLAAPVAALIAAPIAAQDTPYPAVQEMRVADTAFSSHYASPKRSSAHGRIIAAYGPFRVLDNGVATLVDVTRARAPDHFAAMLRAHPAIGVLEFVEAPGTYDDRANLRLGRMIRAAGLITRVRESGSVRSGAVELFIAGIRREIAGESEFAVHAWLDDWGRGAEDYPANAAEHRRYLDYYEEMGMSAHEARAFYSMTNSVPFEQALWLSGKDMRNWLGTKPNIAQPETAETAPALVYLDLKLHLQ